MELRALPGITEKGQDALQDLVPFRGGVGSVFDSLKLGNPGKPGKPGYFAVTSPGAGLVR